MLYSNYTLEQLKWLLYTEVVMSYSAHGTISNNHLNAAGTEPENT